MKKLPHLCFKPFPLPRRGSTKYLATCRLQQALKETTTIPKVGILTLKRFSLAKECGFFFGFFCGNVLKIRLKKKKLIGTKDSTKMCIGFFAICKRYFVALHLCMALSLFSPRNVHSQPLRCFAFSIKNNGTQNHKPSNPLGRGWGSWSGICPSESMDW